MEIVFWDFDGVIKDSVDIKTRAFENLFLPFGSSVARRVRIHHEKNGGVSRFDKIPLYLKWAGEHANTNKVNEFCLRFSESVLQLVIDSAWVPGVNEYLLENYNKQYFVLVTATPQVEINEILSCIGINKCFRQVFGAPTQKSYAIREILQNQSYLPQQALMIGDSEADLAAAQANSVKFLLRRTPLNFLMQANYAGPMFDDLS